MGKSITWVGLDAHKKAIHVAVLVGHETKPQEWVVENKPAVIRRLVKKLVRDADGSEVRSRYEAGPCGYALQRQIEAAGPVICEVIAPALTPRKPGERIKTDRRDARKLAELLRAGLLTEVQAPTPKQEAVRDLCRAREDAKEDLLRCRHRLGKLLLRRGLVYSGGPHPAAATCESDLVGRRTGNPTHTDGPGSTIDEVDRCECRVRRDEVPRLSAAAAQSGAVPARRKPTSLLSREAVSLQNIDASSASEPLNQ
jgi:hypothetical protein